MDKCPFEESVAFETKSFCSVMNRWTNCREFECTLTEKERKEAFKRIEDATDDMR